jgi:hypothetical protein
MFTLRMILRGQSGGSCRSGAIAQAQPEKTLDILYKWYGFGQYAEFWADHRAELVYSVTSGQGKWGIDPLCLTTNGDRRMQGTQFALSCPDAKLHTAFSLFCLKISDGIDRDGIVACATPAGNRRLYVWSESRLICD